MQAEQLSFIKRERANSLGCSQRVCSHTRFLQVERHDTQMQNTQTHKCNSAESIANYDEAVSSRHKLLSLCMEVCSSVMDTLMFIQFRQRMVSRLKLK